MRRSLPLVLLLALAACDKDKAPAPPGAPAAAPGSIGAALGIKGQDLIFSAVYLDGPAAKAGLKPGDRILSIDGAPTGSMSMDKAKAAFRGAIGTKLKLSVATGTEPPREVSVERANVTSKVPMPAAGSPAPPAAPAPAAPPAAPAPAAPAPAEKK